MGQALSITMGNNPKAIPWSSGSYRYLPLFHIYPWALGVEIMLQIHDVGLGSRVPHFDLFWFLLVFSICYKKKFADEG